MQTSDLQPKTCRIHPRGAIYFHKRRKTLVTVPKDYVHIVCEGCEYMVAIPLQRYTIDDVEQIRAQHVKTAHFSDMVSGFMVINEPRPLGKTPA